MSTSTSTTATAAATSANIFSASSFFDQNLLYQSVNNLFSNGMPATKYDLIKVLLLLGSDSYKQLVKELMDYTVKSIKEFDIKNVLVCIKNLIYYTISLPRKLYVYLENYRKYKTVCSKEIELEEKIINKFTIEIVPKTIFWKKIINYQNCKYDIIPSKITQTNNKSFQLDKQYYNIRIEKEDYTLFIHKNIKCEFVIENGIETLKNVFPINSSTLESYFPNYKNYDISYEFNKALNSEKIPNTKEFFNSIFPNKEISELIYNIYSKLYLESKLDHISEIFTFATIKDSSQTGFNEHANLNNYYNRFKLLSLILNRFCKSIKYVKNNSTNHLLFGFKYNISSNFVNRSTADYEYFYNRSDKNKEVYDLLEANNKNGLIDIAQEYLLNKTTIFDIIFDDKDKSKSKDNKDNSDVSILMESDTIPSETLQSIFIKDFMISDEPIIEATKNNKIKIKTIYIKTSEVISKVNNPNYNDWKQRLDELKTILGEKGDNEVLSNLIKDCPSKTIETKTEKKK